jgi:hypothetical protein
VIRNGRVLKAGIVFDKEDSRPPLVERKALENLQLKAFDIDRDKVDRRTDLRGIEDIVQSLAGDNYFDTAESQFLKARMVCLVRTRRRHAVRALRAFNNVQSDIARTVGHGTFMNDASANFP